jgi:non-homologous end joining protein Ku
MVSFGLVSIPVELFSATEAHEPTFHQFEEGTATDLAQALRASLAAAKKRPGKASPADPQPSARIRTAAGTKASADRKRSAGKAAR